MSLKNSLVIALGIVCSSHFFNSVALCSMAFESTLFNKLNYYLMVKILGCDFFIFFSVFFSEKKICKMLTLFESSSLQPGGPTPSLPRSEVPSSRSSMIDSASEMSESDTDAMSLSG